MKIKFSLSIYSKLMILTMGLLLTATIPVVRKTLSIFEGYSRRQAEDINLQLAVIKAQDLESYLMGNIERGKVLGAIMAQDQANNTESNYLHTIIEMEKHLLTVELYEVRDGAPYLLKRVDQESNWRRFGSDPASLLRLQKDDAIPLGKITQGEIMIYNATPNPAIKLNQMLILGAPLASGSEHKVVNFVVVYLPMANAQGFMEQKGQRSMFAVDDLGNLILHSYSPHSLNKVDFRGHPAVIKLLSDANFKKQVRYEHASLHQYFLSAYAKTPMGIHVVVELPENETLVPSKIVRRQSIYVLGIALSLMILFVYLYARNFTAPLEALADFSKQVAKGNFSIKAISRVKSHDEVGHLAQAFDEMVRGLKERDKVKTLFSKFHGSSVAEEMLQSENIMHGSNRQVTVLFSDVRGFTAFSEGHTPEEVVSMLNEYFAIMVAIVNRNHGVVDKFIGDAIMAVWGAPKSTGDDEFWCLKACLEMREELAVLNEKRKARHQIPIMIGIGVHTGPAISGTIGSEERMEYTVIGDTVNQTSRIEASTKAFGTDLLISEEVKEKLGDRLEIEFAGAAEVKGKSEALKLYKVRGIFENGILRRIQTEYSDYKSGDADKVKVVA